MEFNNVLNYNNMRWNIDCTKITICQGESLAIDCAAFEGNEPLNLRPYQTTILLKIGSAVVCTAATSGYGIPPSEGTILPIHFSSRNSLVLNICSARTKSFLEGQLSIEIRVRDINTSELVSVYSQDTVQVVESTMTKLV